MMPEKTKYLNCLGTKPFNRTMVLISALFLSVFFLIANPSSIAYGLSHKIFFPIVANGGITLAWDPNSEPDLAGYMLYIGKTSGNYTQTRKLGLITQYTISDLIGSPPYFFALKAYNQNGILSGFSDEVQYP